MMMNPANSRWRDIPGLAPKLAFLMAWNFRVTASVAGQEDLVVAAKYGFARLNQSTGTLSYIREVWGEQDGPGKAERSGFQISIDGPDLLSLGTVKLTEWNKQDALQ